MRVLCICKETFKVDYEQKFLELYGKDLREGTDYNKYEALASLVRDYIAKEWLQTDKRYHNSEVKQVYYFSMEFLLGRLLSSSLLNLGIRELCKEALTELNISLEALEDLEHDQGLGNGGLGRLAACFLDSMASLNIPGHGCGIRYKYGFFEQKILNGSQVEFPDNWLKENNVWEIKRQDKSVVVKFGGSVNMEKSEDKLIFTHINYEPVLAVPYDTPVVGFKNGTVNTLRLWSAEPLGNDFDFSSFRRGDFLKAIEYKNSIEAISQVLYPDDSFEEGRILRLKQQYFFVSAGIQSIIKNFKKNGNNIMDFDDKVSIHINDTHPALAIPELMRILMDEEGLGWEDAWRITENTISYTNHTILAEALEKWSVDIFRTLLPRIYMIVEEINERFCKALWNKYIGQWDKISQMSIIGDNYVRMANLAIVGSHSVNGVAKLHTEILKKQVMDNFIIIHPTNLIIKPMA
jgi:glycogen phosphorylase